MQETLSTKDIEDIISFNKSTVEERGELFEVDKDCLYYIFSRMNSYNNIQNKRQRIIKKATRILAGITYYQPFGEGNRRTALSATIAYLQRNEFNLLINTVEEEEEIYYLLERTIWKITNDATIFGEIESYLLKRVC